MSMLSCDAGKLLPGAPLYTKDRANRSTSALRARTEMEALAMARKAFVVNETVREKVRHLAGVGVRQDDIAKIVGCAPKTLRKQCREDLDRGVAEANAMVSGYLFASAKGGNVTAQIFWLKSRAHWHEKNVPDGPVARGGEPRFPGGPGPAGQPPGPRTDSGAAKRRTRCIREILRQKIAAIAGPA